MRSVVALVAACLLSSCGNPQAVRDEVQTKLNTGNAGKNVDQMVLNFGPPKASATLSNGDKVLDWYLGSTINDEGREVHCTIRVVANPKGIVQKVTTLDVFDEGDEDTLCSRSIRF
jgi:hypothetical protein